MCTESATNLLIKKILDILTIFHIIYYVLRLINKNDVCSNLVTALYVCVEYRKYRNSSLFSIKHMHKCRYLDPITLDSIAINMTS